MVSDFERRRNDILEAIVELYISTASPVGSVLISRKLRQRLSSATIRNIMAELEEEGLLEQPHTSAGRVPTDRGYRLYVDHLIETVSLTPDESQRLAGLIQPQELELERLLERVGEVLAQESQQAAVVLEPTVKHSRIRQIELLPLGLHRLLCVVVAQETMVVSHVVDVEEPISREEALSLAQFLNTELVGLPIQELLPSLERRLAEMDEAFSQLVKRSMAILQTVLAIEPEERLLLEGTLYLVQQPEFRKNPGKTHQLLRQLELRQALLQRMRADLSAAPDTARASPATTVAAGRQAGMIPPPAGSPKASQHRSREQKGIYRPCGPTAGWGMTAPETCVRIGREVDIEGLEDCSYILAPFGVRQTALGGVGILGPKRMDYRRMRTLVEGVADLLTDLLTQWELNA